MGERGPSMSPLDTKIQNRETLSGPEVGQVQRRVMEAVAKKFLEGTGKQGHELAFRNPAVFFRSISSREFASLPDDTQRKVRFVAETTLALMGARYGKERDAHLSHIEGDEYANQVAAPIDGLQALVRDNGFDTLDQRHAGLLATELAAAFDSAWTQGVKQGWRETTVSDRVSYYSGNAVAAARQLQRGDL